MEVDSGLDSYNIINLDRDYVDSFQVVGVVKGV